MTRMLRRQRNCERELEREKESLGFKVERRVDKQVTNEAEDSVVVGGA